MSDSHRHFEVAVSAEALALAWARREAATAGSVVIVDHEISPRGRLGRLWPGAQERTAVIAIVWRPMLRAEQADLVWIAASLGLLTSVRALLGPSATGLWWPDLVVDAGERRIGETRAEVQLGPGRVASAVITARLDLDAFPGASRDTAVECLIAGLDSAGDHLDGDIDLLRVAYADSCVLVGRRVTARLLPQGAARGTVRGVDALGRLELASVTGLVERVTIVGLDRLEVVT